MTPNEKNRVCRMYLPILHADLYFYNEIGRLYYEFFFEGKLLFTGNDYRPSRCYDPFSIDSMVSLLEWITLAPGDTDREYFDNYTPEQLAWCKTIQRDDLSLYIYDYEGGNEEQQAEAEAYFQEGYTRYIHEDLFSLNDVVRSAPGEKIYITHRQKANLSTLLLKSNPTEAIQKKIAAAIDDSFKKLKKKPYMEALLFNEDQVTFIKTKFTNRKLGAILRQINKHYSLPSAA